MGRVQHTLLRELTALSWLHYLCEDLEPEAPLWPYGLPKARRMLHVALGHRDIAHCGLTLASCRAGGATCFFKRDMEVAKIKFHGRWKSEASLQCYIQEAVAAQVLSALPQAAADSIRCFVSATAFLAFAPTTCLSAWTSTGSLGLPPTLSLSHGRARFKADL